MKYQLDLFGVIVPSLLLWGVVAYVLARAVSKLIARAGLTATSGTARCSISHFTSV
jgi:hypothetical protein